MLNKQRLWMREILIKKKKEYWLTLGSDSVYRNWQNRIRLSRDLNISLWNIAEMFHHRLVRLEILGKNIWRPSFSLGICSCKNKNQNNSFRYNIFRSSLHLLGLKKRGDTQILMKQHILGDFCFQPVVEVRRLVWWKKGNRMNAITHKKASYITSNNTFQLLY